MIKLSIVIEFDYPKKMFYFKEINPIVVSDNRGSRYMFLHDSKFKKTPI